ncbi:hypothetical protein AAY473_038715, partial [Plecturocebus cupreus]
MDLEGANPKPWQFPRGVEEPVVAPKSRIEVWEPSFTFQRMYENAWMSKHKVAEGDMSSWRTSARAVSAKGKCGLGAPTEFLLGHCLAPGKATDAQNQPMKTARREAIPCKAIGAELPKATSELRVLSGLRSGDTSDPSFSGLPSHTENYTIGKLGSQAFRFGLSHTIGFYVSPACKCHITEPLLASYLLNLQTAYRGIS